MRNDRFLKEAEGDEEKARRLKTLHFRAAAAQRMDHRDCGHPLTHTARTACRRALAREAEDARWLDG